MTDVSLRLPLAILDAVIETHDIKLKSERTEEMNILIRSANSARMASNGNALEAYANKALDNMVSELSSMSQGGRNNTAFKFGASIGNMIAAGMISHGIAEPLLISAAMASGLSQYEARAVTRGIERGMQTPFDTSKLSQKNDNKYWLDRTTYKEYIESLPTEEPPEEIELADEELLPEGVKSWINQAKLPKSWIQAALTLSPPMSAVPDIFKKLHHAFQTGELNSNNFSLKEIRDLFFKGIRRPSTKNALDILIEWGVVRANGAYSIYKELANSPLQYEIIGNPSLLNLQFLDMLDRYILELHTEKDLAPIQPSLIHGFGLSLEDAQQWHDRRKDDISPDVAYKLETDKNYWLEELTGDNRYTELDYNVDDDNIGLRTALIKDYLNKQVKKEIQMSQPEIMRLLGLKSASFNAVFAEANITTDLKSAIHVINKPNSCNVQDEIANVGRAKNNEGGRGGHVVWMRIKPIGGKNGKPIYGRAEMKNRWEQLQSGDEDKPTIYSITFQVQLPSLVRFKTEAEIADEIRIKKQKAFEKAQSELEIVGTEQTAPTEVTPEPAKVARKPRYSTRKDRSWNSHDETWVHEQLRAEMYCWLNLELKENGHVADANGKKVTWSLFGASNIIRYINEQCTLHQIDKPVHTLEEYYSSDVLDFSIGEPIAKDEDAKMFKKVASAIISAVQKKDPIVVKKVIVKKQHMTLAETRAWGKAEDKVAYMQSIGVK